MVKFTGELNIENQDLTAPFYLERLSLLFFGIENDEFKSYFSLEIMGRKIISLSVYNRSEIQVVDNVLKKFLNQNKSLSMSFDVYNKIVELVKEDSLVGVGRGR